MIQRHSIILWRREEEKSKSFDEIAEETFQVLNIFKWNTSRLELISKKHLPCKT